MHFDAPSIERLDQLEDQLTRSFLVLRDAVQRGDAVVVTVDDRDLQGVTEPAGAALAHGLLGLVRSLAIEGGRPGWQINLLSVAADVAGEQRDVWVQRLADPAGASGAVVRLGNDHLGRLPA
jgi:hypothetical protein